MAKDGQGELRTAQGSQGDDQFRSFAETSPDLFIRIDGDGRITHLFPSSRTILGLEPEAVVHQHYLDLVHPRDHAQARQAFALLLGGAHAIEFTLQLAHRDKGPVWVEIHASPWFDGDTVVGAQGVIRDISDRKAREDVLRHNNRLLHAQVREQHEELLDNTVLLQNLLNTTSAGIGILRQGRFQYLNEHLVRMSGYPATELLGCHWSMLFADDAGADDFALGWPPPESGLLQAVESRWQRADGSVMDVLFSAVPLVTGDRFRPDDASLTVLDITAEKRAQRQLRAAFSELEQFFNVAVPLCLLSLDCRVLKVNRAFTDFFHCSAPEALDRSCREIWGCEVCATAACPVAQLQAGASRCYQVIDKTVRDRHLACTLHAAPYVDAAGRLSGAVITFFDSRELKKVSADLLATRQQLIQAERLSAIGSLAASMAHEFNNPLCGVRSVVERMARKSEPVATDRELLRLALENCDRMSRLIRDLQQFNSPLSDERQAFDLHRAIESVLLLLNKHLRGRKALICREFGSEPLMVHGSESQIKQVMLNLIKNSGEALAETGGEIRIRTDREGERVRIVLSDTGGGISQEHLPHLFEPFFTTKTAVRETGLGLSVAYGIVKAHGGEILVESSPGRGTTFTVLLAAGIEDQHQGDRHAASIHPDRR